MMAHVGCSVSKIISAIERISLRGWRWVWQIGDVEMLQENTGHPDITHVDAVAKALASVLSGTDPNPEVLEL